MSAVTEVATDIVDDILEVIEATEHINNLNGTTRKQQIIVLIAVGAASAVAAGAISHFVTKKVMRTKFEMLMEEELEKTREFFANRHTVDIKPDAPVVDPEEMLRNIKINHPGKVDYRAMSSGNEDNPFVSAPSPDESLLSAVATEGKVKAVPKNAFEEQTIEAEWKARNDAAISENNPYVISKDDFFEADLGWPQVTYTYFEGDGTLADEREQLVDNVEESVGTLNLARFGWMSENDNTVYVRVPKHEIELEIVRSMGTYAAEVHGFTHADETFERRRKGSKIGFGED